MIGLLIFAVLVFVVYNASAPRAQRKWKRRIEPHLPLLRYLWTDLCVVFRPIKNFFTIRRYRGRNFDPEDFV